VYNTVFMLPFAASIMSVYLRVYMLYWFLCTGRFFPGAYVLRQEDPFPIPYRDITGKDVCGCKLVIDVLRLRDEL